MSFDPAAAKRLAVAIAVPSTDVVHADFAMALAALAARSASQGVKNGEEVLIPSPVMLNMKSCYVAENRNKLVKLAQRAKCEFLLFVDADMVFPDDALLRLLSAAMKRQLPIVGANYVRRTLPFPPGATGAPAEPKGLVRVTGLPTGLMLIDMRVFDRLAYPYFQTPYRPGANDQPELLGEDYFFCETAAAAGIEIWMDTALSLRTRHLTEMALAWTLDEPGYSVQCAGDVRGQEG